MLRSNFDPLPVHLVSKLFELHANTESPLVEKHELPSTPARYEVKLEQSGK
jgi:hypothetical protein